jgi:hypothetical protein
MGYKQILVTDELCGSVQRASGMPLRQHEPLGEEAFDLARDWTSAPVGDPQGGICRCRGLHHTSKGMSCRDG